MSTTMLNKLYIGSLSKTVDETYLEKVLKEREINFGRLEVTNNGYAFADLPEDCNCEDIIKKLNGLEIDGQSIKVELSTSKLVKRKVRNNKVVVHNFPDSLKLEDAKSYLNSCLSEGSELKSLDRANNRSPGKTSYIVTLNSMDDAERILESLNGKEYEDAVLKVVPFSENHFRGARKGGFTQAPNPMYPFRFLVPTHLVGAIIGVGGTTVKKFQVESGARYIIVDVQQRDDRYPHEKPVTVLGSADSQMTALKTILGFLDEILEQRAAEAALSAASSERGADVSSGGPQVAPRHELDHSLSAKALNANLGDALDAGYSTSNHSRKVSSSTSSLNGHLSPLENGGDLPPPVFTTPLPVRILTHDHLVGRLIGKGGANLAGIKHDTNTNITIPSTSERTNPAERYTPYRDSYLERIITIEGERSRTLRAAEAMLCKLRSSYDKDMDYIMRSQENMQSLYAAANFGSTPAAFNMQYLGAPLTPGGGGGGGEMYAAAAMAAAAAAAAAQNGGGGGRMTLSPGPMLSPHAVAFPPQMANGFFETTQQEAPETTYLYIHHGAVGAIIGNRGTNIHMIKQLSLAQVTVDTASDHQDQRRITIIGSPEAQSKAQWLITEKLRTDGFTQGEWPILTCEIPIPLAMVGRIIGKQGKKVLELQRDSHAIIEVPMSGASLDTESVASTNSSGKAACNENGNSSEEYIMVKILGHYWALQSAQRKIRSIVNRQKSSNGKLDDDKYS